MFLLKTFKLLINLVDDAGVSSQHQSGWLVTCDLDSSHFFWLVTWLGTLLSWSSHTHTKDQQLASNSPASIWISFEKLWFETRYYNFNSKVLCYLLVSIPGDHYLDRLVFLNSNDCTCSSRELDNSRLPRYNPMKLSIWLLCLSAIVAKQLLITGYSVHHAW